MNDMVDMVDTKFHTAIALSTNAFGHRTTSTSLFPLESVMVGEKGLKSMDIAHRTRGCSLFVVLLIPTLHLHFWVVRLAYHTNYGDSFAF